jgi:hypothetical protein
MTADCWVSGPGHTTCVSPNWFSQECCLDEARLYRQAGYAVGPCTFTTGSWGPWYFLYGWDN